MFRSRPSKRGSRKKKRVNRSERMCLRGRGKYERVYNIYQQQGEKIVTAISTDPMVYRLIANTSILAFIRVVGLGTFKICYFWIRLSWLRTGCNEGRTLWQWICKNKTFGKIANPVLKFFWDKKKKRTAKNQHSITVSLHFKCKNLTNRNNPCKWARRWLYPTPRVHRTRLT